MEELKDNSFEKETLNLLKGGEKFTLIKTEDIDSLKAEIMVLKKINDENKPIIDGVEALVNKFKK